MSRRINFMGLGLLILAMLARDAGARQNTIAEEGT